MRLVSQSGNVDIPYEQTVLGICDQNNGQEYAIYANTNNPRPFFLADYSTLDKAKKAMEMVRDAYCSLPVVLKNAEVVDEVIEMLKKKNVICAYTADEDGRIEYINNAVFHFPKDEEVEI